MGVKNFYKYFRKKFQTSITSFIYTNHDVLVVELNGLFYQAIRNFEMGECKKNSFKVQTRLFTGVVTLLEDILLKNPPRKKLILIVDGVAGMMKVQEQQQRRYKNALERKYDFFDLNSFSPGTKLMHHLTKYVDFYLRSFMNEHTNYQQVKVYFSNEKVRGEGEMKLCQYIKMYCNKDELILIHNSDSDIVCLSLLLNQNIIICRNSKLYGQEYINITSCRNQIIKQMQWDDRNDTNLLLMDFLLLVFLMGNDYIDTCPSMDNFATLYDIILPIYQKNRQYFTIIRNERKILNLLQLCKFFEIISFQEDEWICKKHKEQQLGGMFPNELMNQALRKNRFNTTRYKALYNEKYFGKISILDRQLLFFRTLQEYLNICVYHELTTFSYPLIKAPFLSDIHYSTLLEGKFNELVKDDKQDFPHESFLYLLWILPPQSKYLLPEAFQGYYKNFQIHFPGDIQIDLNEKRCFWEGRLHIPQHSLLSILNFYYEKKKELTSQEKKRNAIGKMFLYEYQTSSEPERFECYYGSISDCYVKMTLCT
jgi:5'-3' exonuclease